jgi:hypothetical protein
MRTVNLFHSAYGGTCSDHCWACDGCRRQRRLGSSERWTDFAGQGVHGGNGAKLDGVRPVRLKTRPENVDGLVLRQESPEHDECVGVYGGVDRIGRLPEGTLVGKLEKVRLHSLSAGFTERSTNKHTLISCVISSASARSGKSRLGARLAALQMSMMHRSAMGWNLDDDTAALTSWSTSLTSYGKNRVRAASRWPAARTPSGSSCARRRRARG